MILPDDFAVLVAAAAGGALTQVTTGRRVAAELASLRRWAGDLARSLGVEPPPEPPPTRGALAALAAGVAALFTRRPGA